MMISLKSVSFSLLAVLALPIASTNVLPITGPHRFDVSISSASLTDTGRVDPFAKDGRFRQIMLSIFSPVLRCRRKHLEPYMPPITAGFENDKFAGYGLPNGSFSTLRLENCNMTASSTTRFTEGEPFPLVIFSGALATSRLLYSSMLQSIAGAGYIVVSIDHPYDADIVEFPEGTIVQGINISDADLELALSTRVKDIAYVHRQLGNHSFANAVMPGYGRGCVESLQNTVVMGHSFGGAAAAAAMLAISSTRGGINLDGSMFGSVITSGLKLPFMLMGHENKTQETDPSWKAIWPNLTGWKREFEVKKAAHYSFSDLPLVAESLGLQEHLPQEVGQLLGTIQGDRMMNLTVSYVTAFLDFVLKDRSSGVLNQNRGFSEVVLRAK